MIFIRLMIICLPLFGTYDHPISHPELTVGSKAGVEFKYVWDCPYNYMEQEYIKQTADSYGIDYRIVFALLEHESGWNRKALSKNGLDKGAGQIRHKWHKDRMKRLGVTNLFDLKQNVAVVCDLLNEGYQRSDRTSWVLAYYNGGRRYANRLKKPSKYANAIMQRAQEWRN